MQQLILNINDSSKLNTFIEFLKTLTYVSVQEPVTKTPTKQQLINEIKEAVTELQLIQQGKRKARPAKDLLNEL